MTEDEINAKLLTDGFVAGREAADKYADTPVWPMLRQGLSKIHEITSADPPSVAYPKIVQAMGVLGVAARKALGEIASSKVTA